MKNLFEYVTDFLINYEPIDIYNRGNIDENTFFIPLSNDYNLIIRNIKEYDFLRRLLSNSHMTTGVFKNGNYCDEKGQTYNIQYVKSKDEYIINGYSIGASILDDYLSKYITTSEFTDNV